MALSGQRFYNNWSFWTTSTALFLLMTISAGGQVVSGHVAFGDTEELNQVPAGSVQYFRQPDDSLYDRPSRGGRLQQQHQVRCVLPEAWKGQWFQSGIREPIHIDHSNFTIKGTCIESQGDKYVFKEHYHGGHPSFRCLIMNDRHANVLQYKESIYGEERYDSLAQICNEIPGDAILYTMIRMDAPLVECPMKEPPYTFSYNRDSGECRSPISHADQCTDNKRILLRYQACPDVQKTESLEEEVHCIATWKDGAQHYMVGKVHNRNAGSLEEQYRCYAYEKEHRHGKAVLKMAQSGDATCMGVTSANEGAKTMVFTPSLKKDENCKFPKWFAHTKWHSLNGKLTMNWHHHKETFIVVDERRNNSSNANAVTSGTYQSQQHRYGDQNEYWFTSGAHITCSSKVDHSDSHSTIIARHMNGCKSKTVCIQIFKRDHHVVEAKIRRRQDDNDNCESHGPPTTIDPYQSQQDPATQVQPAYPFLTLVATNPGSHRCPYLGRYTTVVGRNSRDFCAQHMPYHSLVVGCGETKMEFHSKCSSEQTTKYECHGHWEEDGMGYLIATPLSRSSTTAHRYCFAYAEGSDGSLKVFSSSDSCRRNFNVLTESHLAFNRTSEGQCAEAVTAGAAMGSVVACDTTPIRFVACVVVLVLTSYLMSASPAAPADWSHGGSLRSLQRSKCASSTATNSSQNAQNRQDSKWHRSSSRISRNVSSYSH